MNGIGAEAASLKTDVVVLKESSSQQAVNLILSFGRGGDSQVQVLDLPFQTDADGGDQPLELVHRVSTYLHVKDNSLAVAPVYESISLPRQNSCSASPVSSAASGPQPTNAVLHPLTGSSGGSIFSSLKRMSKKRKRKRDARRHTIQRIMGVDEQSDGTHLYECETLSYDTRTWPLKEGRRLKTPLKDGGGAAAYMKNPLLTDIDWEGSREDSITPYAVSAGPSAGPSAAHTRTHCRVLSLGSVLSFDLPKDMTLIPSIQDIITIAPPESKREGADLSLHSHKPTVLSSFKQSPEVADLSSYDPPGGFLPPPPPPPKDPPDGGLSNPSLAQCDAAEQQRNKMPSDCSSDAGEGPESSRPSNLSVYVNHPRSAAAVTQKHRCVSVHTRVRDLHGHFYHKCAPSRCGQEQSGGLQVSQASLVKLNPKSAPGVGVRQDSVDSGISSVSSFKLGADVASADSRPKGVVGKLLSLEVGALENHAASPGPPPKSAEEERERVHPDHQEFEEEEEELEDIWNQTPNCRQSICSDIMYRPNQEVSAGSGQVTEALCCSPPAQTQTAFYRDLVTASAPDLLTAELKLPSHVPDLLGFYKAGTPKDHLPPLAKGDRRSWAAFPVGEAAGKTSVTTDETAPAPVKLPDVGDRQRYVYHYREEEEEEEEEGMKVEEVTGCLKDRPLSAVSALVGSDGASQEETPHGVASTGGRRFVLSGKPELQSMEGTLERKQRLQQGGRKAASRGWNCYHAVLSGHTMCFFQDGKDALRSAACGRPLNLVGAECSPASDYTKKPNCFRLRLPDGAEYLFSVSSHFMMRKWVMRVQASTGQGGSVSSSSSADPGVPSSIEASSGGFRCQDGASCHCSSLHGAPITSPSRKPTAKEMVVLSRRHSRLRSRDGHPIISSSDGCCYDDGRLTHAVTHRVSEAPPSARCPPSAGQDWLSTQSRSHSFTSSTYQRIRPTAPSPAGKGLEKGSNYSVTLVVGEKAGESPPPASAGWQRDAHLRSFASLPRPSSKSVFKKFFGKKEL